MSSTPPPRGAVAITVVLLDVLFDPRHVAVFSRSAGRLTLLKQEGSVNEVRFDNRRLIFTCSTTFRRTLHRESGSIGIEMLSFKAGWGRLAPNPRRSRAGTAPPGGGP